MQKIFEFIEHLGKYRVLVQTRDINDGAITGKKVAQRVIDWFHIIAKAIRNEHIDDNAVDNRTLADNAVDTRNIRDKAVTSDKIADKYTEMVLAMARRYHDHGLEQLYKEMAELRQLVTSYVANGIALSTQFGSNDDIGITQRTLTNSINSLWRAIRDMKGENNDGITVQITPDWFISEDTAKVNISAWANDGVFEKLQIYINDEPVWDEPVENEQRIEYTAEMSDTSKVVTKAQILGIEYTDTQYVKKFYPLFIGGGQDFEDIVSEQYVRELKDGEICGAYNVNIEHDGDRIFVIVPSSRQDEIAWIFMNGYKIPMEIINNEKYTIFKSANTYVKGLYRIDIAPRIAHRDSND